MSGVVKNIKNFKKNPLKAIVSTAIVGAAIWFTAGTAANYMAAPELGMGAAMSSQTTTMYTATASAFGASAGAEGLSVSPALGGAETAGASVMVPETATAVGADMTASALPEAAGTITSAGEGYVAAAPETAFNMTNAAGAGNAAAATNVATGAGSGASWIEANPVKSMLLGQGIVSAYSQDQADKEEENRRRSRGLMGFDYSGNSAYTGGGIVSSQVDGQKTMAQTINAPTVEGPAPTRPVSRNNLPQLQKQGLIASNQPQPQQPQKVAPA